MTDSKTTALAFVDVPVPVVTRTSVAKDNPFTAKVAELVAKWDTAEGRSVGAVALTVPKVSLSTYRRQITLAGVAASVSMRVVETDVEGNLTVVHLTFWAVDKITRKSKSPKPAAK